MKVQPYIKGSVRKEQGWKEIAAKLGVHPVVASKWYVDEWCVGVDARDFHNLVMRGEITNGPSKQRHSHRDYAKELAEVAARFTPEQLEAEAAESKKWSEDMDFGDYLHYQLKEIVQVGDMVVEDEDKTFCFSKKQYITAGKKYRILELDDKRDGIAGFTAITNTDIPKERNWNSHLGIRSLWRRGKEIWNWNLAYLKLWQEENPGHPQTQEMIDHCTKNAELMRKGKKCP